MRPYQYFKFNLTIILVVFVCTGAIGVWVGFTLPSPKMYHIPAVFAAITGIIGYLFSTASTMRQNENIAHTCLAMAAFGLFVVPSLWFTYVTLRIDGPVMDFAFSRFDEGLGFDWARVTAWAAARPDDMAWALMIYNSTALALLFGLIWVGIFRKKPARMHEFVTHYILSLLITGLVSGALVAQGPYIHYDLAPQVVDAIGPKVDPKVMAMIQDLRSGVANALDYGGGIGVCSFPSFHTSTALLLIWLARGTGTLFWVTLVWNGAVIVCTPLMGNHYIADVFAGAATVALVIWLTQKIYGHIDSRAVRHGAREPVAISA